MNKRHIIDKIRELDGLTKDEKNYLADIVNDNKQYGLVWENKPEKVEEYLETKLPILKEVKEKAIINDTENSNNPNHILIEGDNLHSLTTLTFTHEKKIDIIYIDPPYNTGKKDDFIYNDKYIDKEDTYRHSKWLSFMNKRLRIAKRLLKDDGVIFCSIGDDEIAQLTLLFNEIFTETNQLGLISRVAKTAGDKGKYFAPSKDYILAYAKNKEILDGFKDAVNEALFKKIETKGEKKGEKYRDDVAFYQSSLDTRPNQRYFIQAPDGSFLIPPGKSMPQKNEDGYKAVPIQGDKVWRWADTSYNEIEKRELLVFKKSNKTPLLDENGNQAKYNVYTKSYLKERSIKGKSPRDFLDNFINRKGADFIKQYDVNFNYSKPLELIEHLIKITDKPNNITVLDFFAGSGTTLHSVAKLNSEDEGKRTCVIATNNENNICEDVTYPRIKNIFNLYTNKKGIEMPFFEKNNLRYFKTDYVERKPSLKNKKALTRLATELLCIRENCYYEITSQINKFKWNKLFTNKENLYTYVIYNDNHIDEAVEELQKFIDNAENKPEIKVYVFSKGQYPYTEDFDEIKEYVELCALPDVIYKAYLNVLPKTAKL